MKILVAYKWAPNPADASVNTDGSLDWSRAKPAVSEYDPVAIQVGRQVADAVGAELVGITVGGPDSDASLARKAALSRGLDRLTIVTGPDLGGLEATRTAALLAAAVRAEGDVRLVLAGDSSVDVGAKLVPSVLAGQLGWPVLSDVMSVSVDGPTVNVEQEFAGGVRTLRIDGPAVLALTSSAIQAPVPGMRDILAAAKKPVLSVAPADLDAPASASEVTLIGRSRPRLAARKGVVIDGSDAEAAAAQLVAALRGAGIL